MTKISLKKLDILKAHQVINEEVKKQSLNKENDTLNPEEEENVHFQVDHQRHEDSLIQG